MVDGGMLGVVYFRGLKRLYGYFYCGRLQQMYFYLIKLFIF